MPNDLDASAWIPAIHKTGRPVYLSIVDALTADIAGFWRGAWADARRDMRGRYPKHNWPENPLLP